MPKKRNTAGKSPDPRLAQTPPRPISRQRLWLFRCIALLGAPLLLIICLELGLRVVGYGFPTPIAIKQTIQGQPSYTNNNYFAWRFFPPTSSRTSDPFRFTVTKPQNTYRIFVLGASAAAGVPDGAFSFGRILEKMLAQQYPETQFEVITPAMPAINSHVVLEIAKDCVHYDPDLFVVYLGNNEIVGPYGAGTVFSPITSHLSLIRLGIAFKETKLGQLLNNLMRSSGLKAGPKVWRGMEMFLNKQIRADHPHLQTVYSHFRHNLSDIAVVAQGHSIPVVMSTVATNLKDSPPFGSLNRPDLTDDEQKQWDTHYKQGVEHEKQAAYPDAITAYRAAAQIDNTYANLLFRLGQCYWQMEDYDQARRYYSAALEQDTLRFRADETINNTIRQVAQDPRNNGIYLADAAHDFVQASPHQLPGEALFYEHVHMNFPGNYLLAKSICHQVQTALPEYIGTQKSIDTPLASEADCAQATAFMEWEQYKFAKQYHKNFGSLAPFTHQLYNQERRKRLQQQIKALSPYTQPTYLQGLNPAYQKALDQSPRDWWIPWKYAEYLDLMYTMALNQPNENAAQSIWTEAIRTYQQVIEHVPQNYQAYGRLAALYAKAEDINAAVTHYQKALAIYPIFGEAYFNLGIFSHLEQDYDQAIAYFRQALSLTPQKAQIHTKLAASLYKQGKHQEAITALRKGLTYAPQDFDLHYNLAVLLINARQKEAAIKELKTAIGLNPNSEKARQLLDRLQGKVTQP